MQIKAKAAKKYEHVVAHHKYLRVLRSFADRMLFYLEFHISLKYPVECRYES